MPQLTTANISFRTNDDDKDHDTNLTVEVRDSQGHLAARASDTFGPFHDQTSNGPFQLEILERGQKQDFLGGTTLLRVDPKGNDTWRFNFILELRFDDGSALVSSANGVEVNQDTEQQQMFGIS